MAIRLTVAFLCVAFSQIASAQSYVAPTRLYGPREISTTGGIVSGNDIDVQLTDAGTVVIIAGAARLELNDDPVNTLTVSADNLLVKSGEFVSPLNPTAKRNLDIHATGHCLLIGQGIQIQGNSLEMKEDSGSIRFDCAIDGDVTVSLGSIRLTADRAVLIRENGNFQLSGKFNIPRYNGEPNDATERRSRAF